MKGFRKWSPNVEKGHISAWRVEGETFLGVPFRIFSIGTLKRAPKLESLKGTLERDPLRAFKEQSPIGPGSRKVWKMDRARPQGLASGVYKSGVRLPGPLRNLYFEGSSS